MQSSQALRNGAQVYLSAVPALTAALGFGIGHISYRIYLPIWLINVCLMLMAAWVLGADAIRKDDINKKYLAATALLLLVPWVLFSVFFGMGPPPITALGWVSTAVEQQVRYALLLIGGVVATLGFGGLKEQLKDAGERFYSQIGLTAMLIAAPIFILNMTFWGSYLVEAFKIFAALDPTKRPEWYLPIRAQFGLISAVEVSLIYAATAAFAASLKTVGWFKPAACRIYILVSSLGFLLTVLPSTLPEPFATAGYLVSIPAIPFIMPYLIGINLLRLVGSRTYWREFSAA